MPRFAQYFRINKGQNELDFVNVDTDRDTPLYIDPYVFNVRNDAWSVYCREAVISFFDAVIQAIRNGDAQRGRALMNHLGEPNETCLGVSTGKPAGRGIGGSQADDLFDRLARSRAAQTGLLSDLSECELFVERIGPDKISDMTTNIIRRNLIEYTQAQCALHSIEMRRDVPSGKLWNSADCKWEEIYVSLPIVDNKKVILVPKSTARWSMAFSHQSYYNEFVLTYLQSEHLRQHSGLVEVLKNGRERVTKKRLIEIHPLSKNFLADFSSEHPEILERYRTLMGVPREVTDKELDEKFDEPAFCNAAIHVLQKIPPGNDNASKYHSLMVGLVSFIFYPNIIYPKKEHGIHDGRKRIDIVYTNGSTGGFFFRRRSEHNISASLIMVECKNYSNDIANAELDQMAGRFSPARGRLGLILGRSFTDRDRFVARCRDTLRDGRGAIIALEDKDIIEMLMAIATNNRPLIDRIMEDRFREIAT